MIDMKPCLWRESSAEYLLGGCKNTETVTLFWLRDCILCILATHLSKAFLNQGRLYVENDNDNHDSSRNDDGGNDEDDWKRKRQVQHVVSKKAEWLPSILLTTTPAIRSSRLCTVSVYLKHKDSRLLAALAYESN